MAGMMLAAISVRAQPAAGAPAAANASAIVGGMELILVAKVTGTAQMTVNGAVINLKVDDKVPRSAKINTQAGSSVVLAFSNGATTHLGADTELIVEEFLQDPFSSAVALRDVAEEPSQSRTKLRLNRGELTGKVAKLKHDKGSTFVVETPVGAAGIRGTTFRIVFTPNGTGQAFFQLSTVEGNVGFAALGSGIDPTTGAAPGAPAPAPAAPGVTAVGDAALPVPGGQQIEITVSVTTNAAGQQVVTIVQPPTATIAIPPTLIAAVTQTATEIAVATQATVFTPVTTSSTGGAGPSSEVSGTTGSTTGSTTGTTGTTSGGVTEVVTPPVQSISGSNFNGTVTQPPRQVTSGDGF